MALADLTRLRLRLREDREMKKDRSRLVSLCWSQQAPAQIQSAPRLPVSRTKEALPAYYEPVPDVNHGVYFEVVDGQLISQPVDVNMKTFRV